jgi:hypothetical protein
VQKGDTLHGLETSLPFVDLAKTFNTINKPDNAPIWETGGAHQGHQGDVDGMEGTSEHRRGVNISGLQDRGAIMKPCSSCDLPSCGVYTLVCQSGIWLAINWCSLQLPPT